MNNSVEKLIEILKNILKDINETLEKLQQLNSESPNNLKLEERLFGKLSTLEKKYKSFKDDLDTLLSKY